MKKIIQDFRTGKLRLEEVPIPYISDNGVLVRNHYSLVSVGTEKAVIEFAKQSLTRKATSRPDLVREVLNKIKSDGFITTYKTVKQRLDSPLPLGYSCAGEVIEAGKNAIGFNKGNYVACGGGMYASHAEVVFIPKNLCIKIPKNISTKEASFVTLGAIALQGIRVANLSPGERVAVIGLGLIGQLTLQILNAYGYQVVGLDINEIQIKKSFNLGLKYGAVIGKEDIDKFIRFHTNAMGVDAVIITASTKSNEPIELAGKICRDKGKVSVVGDVLMKIPRKIYYEKELELSVSRSYGPGRYDPTYEEKGIDYPIGYARWTEKRNMEEFLRLISIGRVNVKPMISHIFKIEDALKAYRLILENPNKDEFTAVLLEYNRLENHKTVISLNNRKKDTSKKDIINAGIIGAGNFASDIILPNLKKIRNVNIKAIADARGEIAKKAGKKYGCQYITSNYADILNDKELDLVIVATRHNLHAKIACEALKKNKNIHLEKPLAMNTDELKAVINAEKKSKARLIVGFNRRFAPFIREAKNVFSKTNTPLMIHYRVNAGFIPKESWAHDPEEGGGRIIGEVCHFVDLLQFLTNSQPKRVYASRISGEDPIVENDNVEITIDFDNGSIGSILYTALGNKSLSKEYLEIFSDGIVMTIDNFKRGTTYNNFKRKKIKSLTQDKGHYGEFMTFANAILKGKNSPIPMNEIACATLVTFKILESLDKKEVIDVNLSEYLGGNI